MTAQIGRHGLRVVEATGGYLVVLVNGRRLPGSYIFQADAIKAAQASIEEARE